VCRAIGLERLLADERLSTVKGRFDNMAEVITEFDAALEARSRDEWGVIFDEHGLIWGPVLGLHEVAVDPQAEAIGLFPTIEHPDVGEYRTVASPMRFGEVGVGPRGPAPRLGEHTYALLASVGYSESEIAGLIEAGAVSTGR
jgi:crotonobetainyl-CoA:carnitine CoA-transferase CaiB-like acyl-CoA transferase